MPITRIISGGQTRADRGGLDAAMYCDIPHGGWCPQGRKAEDGVIAAKYQLQEMESPDYIKRTEANVVDSDATVVFTLGPATGGSLKTLVFCRKHGKPYHHVNLTTTRRESAVQQISEWFNGDEKWNDYEDYEARPPEKCVLNVAGSRESKADGMQDLVEAIVVDMICEMNPDCRAYPLS